MARTTTFRDTTAARHAYRRAGPPAVEDLAGDWDVDVLGGEPWDKVRGWRDRALGIRGLWGLRFVNGTVHHLLGKPRKPVPAKPLAVEPGTSSFDGLATVRCEPTPDLGSAWVAVHYEVRVLEDDLLLGLDMNGPGRWSLPMPFLLHRRQE